MEDEGGVKNFKMEVMYFVYGPYLGSLQGVFKLDFKFKTYYIDFLHDLELVN